MQVWLAELRPLDPATGLEVVVRLSSTGAWTLADGQVWTPRLTIPLRRSLQLFDGAFQDQPQDVGALEFALGRDMDLKTLTSYVWDGRAARIWKGAVGQGTAAMTKVLDGFCAEVSGTKQRASVTLRGRNLQFPLLAATYAGSGGAEGSSDLANVPKPMLIGSATNIQPVYVNAALGIFQYHAYSTLAGQAALATTAVYDSGALLGTSIGDFASYAALAGAVVPPGRFATCNVAGMARHGGAITGVLTIDAQGAAGTGLPGDVMRYLAVNAGGLAADRFSGADFDWLNTALPYPQDIYVTEQGSVEDLMRELMLSLGGYLWWQDDGTLTVGLIRTGGAPVATLDRLNIAQGLRLMPTQPPVWMRRQGYLRSWRVHSFSEVRTPKELLPRGTWSAATSYSYYDLVQFNGRTWVYALDLPGTISPPGSDATWTLFTEDGAPIFNSAVAPANPTPGALWRNSTTGLFSWWSGTAWVAIADVTAQNIASGILGQGALATASSVDWASQVVGDARRPADYATQSSPGSNELIDDTFLPGFWNTTPKSGRSARSNNAGFAYGFSPWNLYWDVPLAGTDAAQTVNNYPRRSAATPGVRYYGQVWLQRNFAGTPGATAISAGMQYLDAAGAIIAGANGTYTTVLASSLVVGDDPKPVFFNSVAPPGTASVYYYLYIEPIAGATGTIRFERPTVSTSEPGADITTTVGYGPLEFSVKYYSTGVVAPGELPRDLSYQLLTPVGVIADPSITWSYRVVSGRLNGKVLSDGAVALPNAQGTGVLTITSMESADVIVEIIAVRNGTTRKATIHGSKNVQNPPPSPATTGTSPGATVSTGMFTSFASTTFIDISGPQSIVVPSGKTQMNVQGAVDLTPVKTGGDGNWNLELKAQRLVGASWVDIGAVLTAASGVSTDTYGGFNPYLLNQDSPPAGRLGLTSGTIVTAYPGSVSFDVVVSVTAGATEQVRLVSRIASGSSLTRSHIPTGTWSLVT